MFYSAQILSRKGNLGLIWIAASMGEKKLKKQQVFDIDLAKSVERIIDPEDRIPLALRLSGQLLLGVVRIYLQKVKFLFDDCESVLDAIQQAFKTQALALNATDKAGVTVHRATITIPDNLIAEGSLDPALLPLELNVELADLRHAEPLKEKNFGNQKTFSGLTNDRRISMDASLTRRQSLTEMDILAKSPGGSRRDRYEYDQDGFGFGLDLDDLGITPRDIEIQTERLRAAKQQRSSERRTLTMDYEYAGGAAGGYDYGEVEPEVLRGESAPREARLNLDNLAGTPLSTRGKQQKEQRAPGSAAQSPAPVQLNFSGRRSLGSEQRAPLAEANLDDLLPPADFGDLLEPALKLPLNLERRGTPQASPREQEAAPESNRRVLRKRKPLMADLTAEGEVKTTLAGAQIKALIRDRAPLMARRGRKARARKDKEKGEEKAEKLAAEAAALVATPGGRRSRGEAPAPLMDGFAEDGPVADLFQELVRERTEAAAASTPGRPKSKAGKSPAVREGNGTPGTRPRRASLAAQEDPQAAPEAEGAPPTQDDYEYGGGLGGYDYDLPPGGTPFHAEDDDDLLRPAKMQRREPEAQEPGAAGRVIAAAAETALSQRSHAFLRRVKAELGKPKNKKRKQVTLQAMARNQGRAEVARMFYECLVLKAHGKLELQQPEAFGNLAISLHA